jgi:hypothetical protein
MAPPPPFVSSSGKVQPSKKQLRIQTDAFLNPSSGPKYWVLGFKHSPATGGTSLGDGSPIVGEGVLVGSTALSVGRTLGLGVGVREFHGVKFALTPKIVHPGLFGILIFCHSAVTTLKVMFATKPSSTVCTFVKDKGVSLSNRQFRKMTTVPRVTPSTRGPLLFLNEQDTKWPIVKLLVCKIEAVGLPSRRFILFNRTKNSKVIMA